MRPLSEARGAVDAKTKEGVREEGVLTAGARCWTRESGRGWIQSSLRFIGTARTRYVGTPERKK
jgi:hypothetical protein